MLITKDMPILIKPTNLTQLYLSKIIQDHMNLKNIWVIFCIPKSFRNT